MTRTPGKYGRRPPKNGPALRLAHYLTGAMPTSPPAEDYLAVLGGGWQMLGNDQHGDCVAVAWANNRRLVSTTLGIPAYPTQDQVYSVYETQNPNFPSDDNGMDIQTLLEWLCANAAPDGSKAVAYAKVDQTNLGEVRAAIAIFGSLILGINVNYNNQTNFQQNVPWDYDSASGLDGGHGVVCGGYGNIPADTGQLSGDEKFITWGQETSFTDAFWSNQVEEAYVLIYPEHLGTKSFLEGVNATQLAADYQEMFGQSLPTTPTPTPPGPAPTSGILEEVVHWFEEVVAWVRSHL